LNGKNKKSASNYSPELPEGSENWLILHNIHKKEVSLWTELNWISIAFNAMISLTVLNPSDYISKGVSKGRCKAHLLWQQCQHSQI
jgi:hypothetical protein